MGLADTDVVRGRPRRTRHGEFVWSAALVLPAALIIASLLAACAILLRYSFNHWDPVHTTVPGFTLSNYEALFGRRTVRVAFANTIRFSVVVTLVCLLLGYPVAYGIVRSRRRDLLVFLLIAPLMIDVLLRAYGWMVMLGQGGLINTVMVASGVWAAPKRLIFNELSVIIGMVHEVIPFMVLPIVIALERINPELREAAYNLGAGPFRAFTLITLPLSVSGIIAGTLLTFALSVSAFVVPLILGGGSVLTVTLLVQQQMLTTLNWPLGAAESLALVFIVVVALILYRQQVNRLSGARS